MFEYWTEFNAVFLLFMVTGYAIYRFFDRRTHQGIEKKRIYACGERWDQQEMPSGFYDAMTGYLRIKKLSLMHSGNISDYLLWAFAGIVAIMMLFSVLYV